MMPSPHEPMPLLFFLISALMVCLRSKAWTGHTLSNVWRLTSRGRVPVEERLIHVVLNGVLLAALASSEVAYVG